MPDGRSSPPHISRSGTSHRKASGTRNPQADTPGGACTSLRSSRRRRRRDRDGSHACTRRTNRSTPPDSDRRERSRPRSCTRTRGPRPPAATVREARAEAAGVAARERRAGAVGAPNAGRGRAHRGTRSRSSVAGRGARRSSPARLRSCSSTRRLAGRPTPPAFARPAGDAPPAARGAPGKRPSRTCRSSRNRESVPRSPSGHSGSGPGARTR